MTKSNEVFNEKRIIQGLSGIWLKNGDLKIYVEFESVSLFLFFGKKSQQKLFKKERVEREAVHLLNREESLMGG